MFKQTDVTGVVSGNVYSRLGTTAGSHRYQYWVAAVHAFESKPLTGIGPGTFQFYWAQHGSLYEFIRNAHSLYLETLAETGVLGGALIVAFLLVLLVAGVARALRARAPARAVSGRRDRVVWSRSAPRPPSTGCGSWRPLRSSRCCWASRSWPQSQIPWSTSASRERRWPTRIGLAALALLATVAIGIPFGTTAAIRSSQGDVSDGNLSAALSAAATAQQTRALRRHHPAPARADPRAQRRPSRRPRGDRAGDGSRVHRLEHAGSFARGSTPRAATRRRRQRDYRRAHELNPLSPTTAYGGVS